MLGIPGQSTCRMNNVIEYKVKIIWSNFPFHDDDDDK